MFYNLFLIGALLFALLTLFVITSAFFGFLITRVPFVPTYASDVKFIVGKLNITDKEVFYDLGSGNGKVVFLVNKLTGAKCVGFELTWWTYLLALMKQKTQSEKHKIEFHCKDFFKENWLEANYVYGYLYPMLMGRVEEKFLADCKPGSVAIIRDFPFPNLEPIAVYNLPKKHEVYIYRK